MPSDTAPHRGSQDPYSEPLDPNSQAIATAPRCSACMCMDSDVETLRVITARERVVLSGSLYVSLKVSETAPPLPRGHANRETCTVWLAPSVDSKGKMGWFGKEIIADQKRGDLRSHFMPRWWFVVCGSVGLYLNVK